MTDETAPDTTVPDAAVSLDEPRPVAPWLRRLALGACALRLGLPILALPLVPVLLDDRFLTLLTLRPGKEFLLLGGFRWRIDAVHPAMMLLAYLPLMVVGVWAFFVVGRAYGHKLEDGTLPRWAKRLLPPAEVHAIRQVLGRRGPVVAVLGRLGALPPTVIAAAAGTSEVSTRRFLVADLVGALAAFAVVVGLGYALGETYERAGVWLTVGGLVVVVTLLVLFGRWLRAELSREQVEEPDWLD